MAHQDWLSGSRLKLRHLRLLAGIGSTGSLGLAAQGLRITQPAASRLLAEVEGIVGEAIFERTPRGLRPNAYGEVAIRRARTVMAELGAAGEELDVLRSGFGGAVALGVVTAPAVDTVAKVLTNLQQTHPSLRITVEVDTSIPLVRMLSEGKLDFVLARIPADQDPDLLEYTQVGPEELAFVVREDHPLLAGKPPRLADLVDLPWVMQPPNTLLRKRVDAAFRAAGLSPPKRVLNTSSALLTIAIIARGGIVGALTASVATLFNASGTYRLLASDDPIHVEAFGLIKLRGRPLSPAAQHVYDAIDREFRADD